MSLIDALKEESNYKYTENFGIAKSSTCNKLYDLFALGGAYRGRSDSDCILLFKEAYDENPTYALKCLFYLRDIRGDSQGGGGGQGERRFFRVCFRWLARYDKAAVIRNIPYVSEYGRFDDLYCLVGTPCEKEMFDYIKEQVNFICKEYK